MVTEYGRSAYGEPIVAEHEYFERAQQVAALSGIFSRASSGQTAGGLIEGPRGIGKSDLIRRAILSRLNDDPSSILIYYPIQPYTLELFDLARSYFNTFVRQHRYCRDRDQADLQECVDAWHSKAPQCERCTEPVLREMCEALGRAYAQRDVANTISLLVNLPRYLTELQGRRCVVILDHARHLGHVHRRGHSVPLLRQLADTLESSASPLFLADSSVALRTLLGEQSAGDKIAVFEPARLDPHEALAMIETLCERLGVGLSVRTVERMLARFGGLPLTVHSLVRRAHLSGLALDTTEHVGTIYAQEIRDGMIHWYWRVQFSTQFPQSADRQVAAELCSHLASCHPERIPLAQLSNRLSLEPARLQEMIRQLQLMGVLDRSFGTVGLTDDPVMRDVVTVLAWGENSSTSDAELLRRLAARRVCGASTPPAEETNAECLDRLQRFLQSFRGQYLPAEWFHYRDDFGAGWTGAEGIRRSLGSSDTLVRLPFLMAVSRTDVASLRGESTGLRPIVFRGSGFRDRQLTPGNETQWLAVVWLTADPVGVEHVEETLRVKDEIARRTGRAVSHVWLIGKATFSREARQRCAQSNLFTGNMAMVEYIHDQMSAPGSPYAESVTPPPVPEMIGRPAAAALEEPFAAETLLSAEHFPERRAAEIIEQVAQAAGFSLARIGQIKLALLEVVILAAETSVDPSNRLLLRHRALADRLDVSLRYWGPSPPPLATEPPPESQSQAADKGLHLAYSLADQVTIRSDAGVTEIQLTFRREAQAADGGGQRQEANA